MNKDNKWFDDHHFNYWLGKLSHFPVYQRQKEEVQADLKKLGKTYLDIGGGDGRMQMGDVIDLQTGVDITKNWEEQLGKKIEPVDVVFTSLVLIVLNEEEVDSVIRQMRKYAKKAIYIYEEVPNFNRKCGEIKNPENKEKYNHFWTNHFKEEFENGKLERLEGKAHPKAWEKIMVRI